MEREDVLRRGGSDAGCVIVLMSVQFPSSFALILGLSTFSQFEVTKYLRWAGSHEFYGPWKVSRVNHQQVCLQTNSANWSRVERSSPFIGCNIGSS